MKLKVKPPETMDNRRICRAFDSSSFLRRVGVDENMGGVALVLGHIVGYILRPNIELQILISRIQAEMDFESWKHRSIGVRT